MAIARATLINPKSKIQNSKSLLGALCVLCGFIWPSQTQADIGDFVLVRRSFQVQTIRLTAMDDQYVVHLPADKDWEKVALSECIALLNPQVVSKARSRGLIILADGQRLPGEAVTSVKPPPDALAWNHPWLERIDVPLKLIESVLFTPDAEVPAPAKFDVLMLANGDRQEGIVTALGNPISIEVTRNGQGQIIDIPLARVVAITMVAPRLPPSGRRIWFDDGTVIDVQSITVGDDGFVRLAGSSLAAGTQPTRAGLSQIAAILLDPQALIPLATLAPSRIEGSSTRYVLSKPHLIDPGAPLGLSRLEYRGPIVVRYTLPPGCQRFTAEAELPIQSRQWGDYELIVRSEDQEVFRNRLNADNSTALINVPITGRELTIELTQGARGSIQDQLILNRAMLLKTR